MAPVTENFGACNLWSDDRNFCTGTILRGCQGIEVQPDESTVAGDA
jgi:hypothetical protein